MIARSSPPPAPRKIECLQCFGYPAGRHAIASHETPLSDIDHHFQLHPRHLTAALDGSFKLWNSTILALDGEHDRNTFLSLKTVFHAHPSGGITSICVSPDTFYFVSAATDGSIKM